MKYFLETNHVKSVELSYDNLTVTSIFNEWKGVRSNLPVNTTNKDKIYFECYIDSVNANNAGITLITKSQNLDYHNGYYYWSDGNGNNPSWEIGDTISILYDKTSNNGTLTFFVNGKPESLKYTNLNKEYLYLGIIVYNGAKRQKISVNFGKTPFRYMIPNAYKSLENMNKYLLKLNNEYYSFKSSFYKLGGSTTNQELEKWYQEHGINNLSELIKKKNSKSVDLKLDKNDIYKTTTLIDFNEATNDIKYTDQDNKKEITYNVKEYQLLDLVKEKIGSKFQIAKWQEGDNIE